MLRIGTAGIPHSTKLGGIVNGIKRVKELGLTATEIEFVHSIYMSETLAKEVKKTASKLDIALTVHAPFYINLNSDKEETIEASIKRIVKSAKIGKTIGARSVTFHPAYYMGKDKKEVYETVKKALKRITKEVSIKISPETTGKVSQFGSLKELLQLTKEVKGVSICIDFAHLHARSNGGMNSKQAFDSIFKLVKKYMSLKDLHMHVSGINYSAKGERNHLQLPNSDFKIKELVASLKSNKVGGVLIAESPNPEKDALLIQSLLKA